MQLAAVQQDTDGAGGCGAIRIWSLWSVQTPFCGHSDRNQATARCEQPMRCYDAERDPLQAEGEGRKFLLLAAWGVDPCTVPLQSTATSCRASVAATEGPTPAGSFPLKR